MPFKKKKKKKKKNGQLFATIKKPIKKEWKNKIEEFNCSCVMPITYIYESEYVASCDVNLSIFVREKKGEYNNNLKLSWRI